MGPAWLVSTTGEPGMRVSGQRSIHVADLLGLWVRPRRFPVCGFRRSWRKNNVSTFRKTSKTGSAQYGTYGRARRPGLLKHVSQDFPPPFFFWVHPCPTPTLVYFFFSSPKWEGATSLGSRVGLRLRRLPKIHKDFGKVTFTHKGL